MGKKKGIILDMLLEGNGGELVFAPVTIEKKSDIKKLLETKNSVIRENLKKELSEKKM
jgi:hypothetical protein